MDFSGNDSLELRIKWIQPSLSKYNEYKSIGSDTGETRDAWIKIKPVLPEKEGPAPAIRVLYLKANNSSCTCSVPDGVWMLQDHPGNDL